MRESCNFMPLFFIFKGTDFSPFLTYIRQHFVLIITPYQNKKIAMLYTSTTEVCMQSDFYGILRALPESERQRWQRFRTFLQQHLLPKIDDHWNQGTFPHDIIEPFGRFLLQEFGDQNYQFPPTNPLAFLSR